MTKINSNILIILPLLFALVLPIGVLASDDCNCQGDCICRIVIDCSQICNHNDNDTQNHQHQNDHGCHCNYAYAQNSSMATIKSTVICDDDIIFTELHYSLDSLAIAAFIFDFPRPPAC